MAFMDFLFGKSAGPEQFSRFNEQQSGAMNDILQQVLSGLKSNEFDFQPIENQARTQFSQQTIPSIAERFTSMGDSGQKSSAFTSALGRAGSGLEQGLAALKSQHGMQSQGLLQNLLGIAMTPQFDTGYFQRQPGFAETSIAQILPTLLQALL